MARKNGDEIVWIDFNVESLPEDLEAMVHEIHQLERRVAEIKRDFRKGFMKALDEDENASELRPPEGYDFLFGFNFGKFAIAYTEKKGRSSSDKQVGFGGKAAAKPKTRTRRKLSGAIKRD